MYWVFYHLFLLLRNQVSILLPFFRIVSDRNKRTWTSQWVFVCVLMCHLSFFLEGETRDLWCMKVWLVSVKTVLVVFLKWHIRSKHELKLLNSTPKIIPVLEAQLVYLTSLTQTRIWITSMLEKLLRSLLKRSLPYKAYHPKLGVLNKVMKIAVFDCYLLAL